MIRWPNLTKDTPKYSLREAILRMNHTAKELKEAKQLGEKREIIDVLTECLEERMFDYRRSRAEVERNLKQLDRADTRRDVARAHLDLGEKKLQEALRSLG